MAWNDETFFLPQKPRGNEQLLVIFSQAVCHLRSTATFWAVARNRDISWPHVTTPFWNYYTWGYSKIRVESIHCRIRGDFPVIATTSKRRWSKSYNALNILPAHIGSARWKNYDAFFYVSIWSASTRLRRCVTSLPDKTIEARPPIPLPSLGRVRLVSLCRGGYTPDVQIRPFVQLLYWWKQACKIYVCFASLELVNNVPARRPQLSRSRFVNNTGNHV